MDIMVDFSFQHTQNIDFREELSSSSTTFPFEKSTLSRIPILSPFIFLNSSLKSLRTIFCIRLYVFVS